MDQIEQHFMAKEKSLEELYTNSKLRHSPDEKSIKKVLLECLEEHYGSLSDAIETESTYKDVLRQIQKLVEKI
jgi:hypothetical protein